MAWFLRLTLVVLAAAAVAGCGESEQSGPEPTTEPVAGLVAELGTNRLYAVDRAFGLALENVSDESVVVSSLRLESPLFAADAPTDQEVTVTPGRRLVVPLPYGEVRCDVEPTGTFGIAVVLAGGQAHHLEAVEEYDGAVARLHQRECAAAEVHQRVDLAFGDRWDVDGGAARGALTMAQRWRGDPVAVDDVVGNVIFTLVLEQAHPVLRVSDGAPTATVPVTVRADRCDPHAVAEFKRPYVFLSWVAVGDGAPVPVELELTGGARVALDALIAACSV